MSRANFVKARLFSVYIPALILFTLQIAAMIIFLRDLDDINQRLDNVYPVDEPDQLMKQYFVILSILLFFIAPLFMSVSFIAYALELNRENTQKK